MIGDWDHLFRGSFFSGVGQNMKLRRRTLFQFQARSGGSASRETLQKSFARTAQRARSAIRFSERGIPDAYHADLRTAVVRGIHVCTPCT